MASPGQWLRRLVLSLAGLASAAQAADAQRGRALYEGRLPLTVTAAGGTTPRHACAACHRPSGMGTFEGGMAVPPVTGPTLFKPFDQDTARFFAASARFRVRPAYDEATLGRLLRTGITPDG